MGRIRTVKPECFLHEGLFELEAETGLPIRIAFIGLWTQCDREGRFRWKPKQLKLGVLPWDDVNFEEVLTALERSGYVERYACGSEIYGHVPTFIKHQVINNKEAASKLPAPPTEDLNTVILAVEQESVPCPTGQSRVVNASVTREEREAHATLKHSRGTGREKEREKEKELEGKGSSLRSRVESAIETVVPTELILNGQISKENAPLVASKQRGNGKGATLVSKLNTRRLELHKQIYGVDPLTNAQTNGMLSNLVKLAGENLALPILEYFYAVPNKFYRDKGHPLQLMIHDLEKLATEVKRQAPIMPDLRAKEFELKKHNAALREEYMKEAIQGEDV